MNNIIEIPANFKISLTISMKNQINAFKNEHHGKMDIYQDEEDLFDSLFFYWVRNSSRKDYKWLKQKNIYFFLNNYSPLLKLQLKNIFNKMDEQKECSL